MRDVIVVGAGIIGATTTAALRSQGRDVLLLDDARPLSGTRPSGGHLKPSWFGGLSKADYEPAMELLEAVWGLKEEQFVVRPTKVTTTVYRVDTDAVAQIPRTEGKVISIRNLHNYPAVTWLGGEDRCRLLIVAAGAWCAELVPEIQLQAKQGVSFRFSGQLSSPFIKPWAPYKQVVAHQQGEHEIWIGDGSAILESNWTTAREVACQERCSNALKGWKVRPELLRSTTGLRPYCKLSNGDPCLLKQLGPRAWVATGAGKSGTIAAGWAARRLLDAKD